MKNISLLIAITLMVSVFSIYSCQKESLSTGSNTPVDLLQNNHGVTPLVLSSFFLSSLPLEDINVTEMADSLPKDTNYIHVDTGSAKTLYYPRYWVHIDTGANATSFNYVGPGVHLDTGTYKTQMIPVRWGHIDSGPDKTTYGPTDWVHIETGADKTGYKLKGYTHVEKGPNKTYYQNDSIRQPAQPIGVRPVNPGQN